MFCSMTKPKYSTAIKDYMAKTVPRETYIQNHKDICQSCEKYIGFDIERYEQRGNYCDVCERQCEQISRERRMTECQLDQIFRARYPDENIDRLVERLKAVI